MVILALNNFETGHPALALLAAVLNCSWVAPGTRALTWRWIVVMAKPDSSFSSVTVASVAIRSGFRPALFNCADKAMEKQPAWAAPINSSGFVPFSFSKRVTNEYGALL